MREFFIISVITFFLSSCSIKEEDKILARVNEENLLLTEVINKMPINIEDSAYFVQKYMNKWIRKQLMIYHAEINLSTNLLSYETQIEDYRSSLLIYAYQQELLNQNFDTTITNAEIDAYFQRYKYEFKLSKNIFKGRFIVVDRLAPNIESLNRWFKLEEDIDDNLVDYCQQFAKEYYLEDDHWQYFSIFNEKLPKIIDKEDDFLSNTRGVWFEDTIFRYYVFIKDYKLKGSISPLSIEKEKIKNVLLNKKKIEYLKQLEDELYQNALALKKIKIY
ncbi:hypothetical protein OAK24_00375 [Flavobacteriales bacterium]|nr:hypothetical protein [Flavobacteriales bacterium]